MYRGASGREGNVVLGERCREEVREYLVRGGRTARKGEGGATLSYDGEAD